MRLASKPVRILALDTVDKRCSVALLEGGDVCSSAENTRDGEHVRTVVALMELALSKHGIWYDGLDYVAVTTGPGSFTGIRIGITAVTAIETATNAIPIGISSFLPYSKLLSMQGYSNAKTCIVMSASKNNFAVLTSTQQQAQEFNKNELVELLEREGFAAITGNCNDMLETITRTKQPMITPDQSIATLCGMIANDIVINNQDIEYPVANYVVDTKIKKNHHAADR